MNFAGFQCRKSLDLKSSDLREIIEEVLAGRDPLSTPLPESPLNSISLRDDLPGRFMLDAAKIKQVKSSTCATTPSTPCRKAVASRSNVTLPVRPVVLEISDNGIGIPDEVNIFALFKTTKLNGSGLRPADRRADCFSHNGTINYTSEPDGGTTFRIVFRGSV